MRSASSRHPASDNAPARTARDDKASEFESQISRAILMASSYRSWDDMLLHIFRMTDKRTDVLSVYTLLREVPAPLKPIVESHIAIIRTATEFARHARHNSIAHRNLNVALGVTPLTLGSRNDIRGALKAIDDLLHAIEYHFLKTNPTNYNFLDNIGGVDSLLDIVDRGLKSRDAQFGYFRSSHPPDPS
jgi:AbiU2